MALLLWNTVRLAFACTALCALLGVGAAWLRRAHRRAGPAAVGRPAGSAAGDTQLRRRLRLRISIDPSLHGYLAAVMVMTLSLYPLVFLPVASALANLDGSLEEAARSLGMSPLQAFAKVTHEGRCGGLSWAAACL